VPQKLSRVIAIVHVSMLKVGCKEATHCTVRRCKTGYIWWALTRQQCWVNAGFRSQQNFVFYSYHVISGEPAETTSTSSHQHQPLTGTGVCWDCHLMSCGNYASHLSMFSDSSITLDAFYAIYNQQCTVICWPLIYVFGK